MLISPVENAELYYYIFKDEKPLDKTRADFSRTDSNNPTPRVCARQILLGERPEE